MVISAIHNLGEKNGSSPQDIVRFISGKYKINENELKPHIQAALNRCYTFGLLSQESGLYRLNQMDETPSHIIPTVFQNRKKRRGNNNSKIKKRYRAKRRLRQRRKVVRRARRNTNNLLVRKIYRTSLLGQKRRLQRNRISEEEENKRKRIRKRKDNVKKPEGERVMNGEVFKDENLESTSKGNEIVRDE